MYKWTLAMVSLLLISHVAFSAELTATYSCDKYKADPKLLKFCKRAVSGIETAKQVHIENEQTREEAIAELTQLQALENTVVTKPSAGDNF